MLRPEARCVLGDLDAIALELKRMAQERANPAATEILLTIEPLFRSSFPPVVKSMSLGEVDRKQGATFVLPQTPGRTLAGVFICMAQVSERGDLACRDKKVVPYQDVLENYRVEVDLKTGSAHKHPSSGPVEDKISFFRYLILHDDLVSFSSQPVTRARYEALSSLLTTEARGDGKATDEVVDVVKALNELHSMPLKKDGDQLIVTLPFYDRANAVTAPDASSPRAVFVPGPTALLLQPASRVRSVAAETARCEPIRAGAFEGATGAPIVTTCRPEMIQTRANVTVWE